MLFGGVGTCQHEHVDITHLLLLVGQLQELFIDLVQFLLTQLHAIYMQTVLQGSTTTTCSEHNRTIVNAHILRIHDFICLHVL